MEEYPSEWTMQMSQHGEVYHFVEDENANITGWGHQDKREFAAAVNRYDLECGAGYDLAGEYWEPEDIGYVWATLEERDLDDVRIYPCHKDDPGAVALTVIWGKR